MKFIYFIILCFLPACMVRPVGIDNRPSVDECNFHVNHFGKGYRWNHLPVPITFHSNTIHDQARLATLKVIDEWNQVWNSESGQNQGLFEMAGWVHYDSAMDVRNKKDKANTVTLIDRAENSSCGQKRCFLKKKQQGVTSMAGLFSLSETDVFLNDGDYDFYYEQRINNKRSVASLAVSAGFFRELWEGFLQYLLFWKKPERDPSSKRRFIPKGLIDFESLVAHELGHVLGLGHIETEGSIMRRKLGSGVMRRGLRRIELDSLLCGYGAREP